VNSSNSAGLLFKLKLNLLKYVLESILRSSTVLQLIEVLDFLQLLKLLVVPDMGIVGRQAHQIMDQTEQDQKGGQGGQYEHDLSVLHAVFAKGLDLILFADLHILEFRVRWKHEI